MYDKESELMLKFIHESRVEMTDTANKIHEEQEELREAASRLGRLPWIFPGAPLTFNGAPGNIQGNGFKIKTAFPCILKPV